MTSDRQKRERSSGRNMWAFRWQRRTTSNNDNQNGGEERNSLFIHILGKIFRSIQTFKLVPLFRYSFPLFFFPSSLSSLGSSLRSPCVKASDPISSAFSNSMTFQLRVFFLLFTSLSCCRGRASLFSLMLLYFPCQLFRR